jgi:hypothetical protein
LPGGLFRSADFGSRAGGELQCRVHKIEDISPQWGKDDGGCARHNAVMHSDQHFELEGKPLMVIGYAGSSTMTQTFTVGARSIFVTSLAWVTIVAGLLLAASAGGAGLAEITGRAPSAGPWALSAVFALSLAAVMTAVGLLMRLDWARRAFIGLLALAIFAPLPGLWLQYPMLHRVVSDALQDVAPAAAAIAPIGVAGVLVVLAGGLLGLAIRRLMSPMVRQEFV